MQRHETPGTRTFYPTPRDEVRAEAHRRGEYWAAVTSGTVEGILEALERYDLAQQTKDAMQEAGSLTQAVVGEGRKQASDPTMQELGHDVQNAATQTWEKTRQTASETIDQGRQKTRELRHELEEAWDHQVVDRYETARDRISERVDALRSDARWTWTKLEMRAQDAWQDVKIRGRAVGEAGHRALHAPRLVAKDVGQAVQAKRKGMMSSMGLYLAAGVVGLTTFIVLTIAVVAGLNALFGAPAGTFAAALIYGIAAVGIVAAAKAAKKSAAEESARHMENARQQVRDVVRPLQVAFEKDLEEYRNG